MSILKCEVINAPSSMCANIQFRTVLRPIDDYALVNSVSGKVVMPV